MAVAKVRRGAFYLGVIGSNNCISIACEQSALYHGDWLHLALATDDAPHGKGRFIMEEEIWKDIPGYEGLYQVSNMGQVRSLDFIVSARDGRKIPHRGRMMKLALNCNGYWDVRLRPKRHRPVHRLVMLAFVGPCPPGMEVNHKNGIRADARLENLEYVTKSQNMMHAIEVLHTHRSPFYHMQGEAHYRAKLTNDQVMEIRQSAASGVRQVDLSTKFGISRSVINAIIKRRIWKHIP